MKEQSKIVSPGLNHFKYASIRFNDLALYFFLAARAAGSNRPLSAIAADEGTINYS